MIYKTLFYLLMEDLSLNDRVRSPAGRGWEDMVLREHKLHAQGDMCWESQEDVEIESEWWFWVVVTRSPPGLVFCCIHDACRAIPSSRL